MENDALIANEKLAIDDIVKYNDIVQTLLQYFPKFDFDFWDGERKFGYGGHKYIPGRWASVAQDLIKRYDLVAGSKVLDVGCGLGGPARFVASRFGCLVSGIDLTHEYVDTGNILSNWVGLHKKVVLQQGSAMALPFPDGQFDAVYMMHVGMNIVDKKSLFMEVFKVLKPDGIFGIYDVMQIGLGLSLIHI